MSATRLVTADELLHMPDDGYKYELVEGRLIRMPPPGFQHGVISVAIASALHQFVEEHGLGVVLVESGFKLTSKPDTVRGPDVSFVRRERLQSAGVPRGYWSGAPDLAVEVVSPDDRPSEIAAKIREYVRLGVQMIWLVDPDARTLSVYRPDVASVTLSDSQEVDGGEVVPGFRYSVGQLFQQPKSR